MLWPSPSTSSSSSSSPSPSPQPSSSSPSPSPLSSSSSSAAALRLFLVTWLALITIHQPTALEARMSKSLSRGTYYLKNYDADDDNDDDGDDDASYHHDNRMEVAALFDEPGKHKDAEVDDDNDDHHHHHHDGSPEARSTEWENESRLFPRFLINDWSQAVHDSIVTIATKATSISDIQTDFLMAPSKLSEVDGLKLLLMYKERLETMLKRKSDALERIVRKAEESFSQYVQTTEVQTNYPKAKNLSNDFELSDELDRDFGVPVNKNQSSVHVPTNVYDESTPILHGVVWSKPLDEVFAKNYEEDSGLSWQFFASSAGFLRIFPGTRWPNQPDDIDLHDSRLEPWYIRAANSPKDAVILIDSSGSMRGLRREIARTTVEKIVQTFGVDDFFNVLKFSDVLEYLDPCNNGSLIQGTASNKQAVLESLKTGMKTANMANYVLAFSEAFELLNRESRNQSNSGSGCNKLVMLITDGVTEKYETLFQSFQEKWPKSNVRIFTYLIGREVADAEKVKWIACHNKGYHSHISTMADVHEHIQEYVHVVSRPMVMSRADHVVWTTNHMNILKSQATITISRPVYDIRENMFSSGSLLGVAAIDVPTSEFVREIPMQELGTNGYAFLVTNNGHVLLHPKLKLQMTELHDIKTMDISNIEFDDAEIRKKTINRETGLIKLKSKFTSFDNKRIFVQNRWYAFTPIGDTSFSLCLSLPNNPVTLLSGEGLFNEHHDFTLDFRTSHFKLAPWFYCKLRSNLEYPPSFPSRGWFHVTAQQLSHEEELLLAIEKSKLNSSINWKQLSNKCNTNLLQQLLFDSMATRSVVPNWLKADNIHGSNQKLSDRYGIESLFLMTKSGLTRYYHFQANHTEPTYLEYDSNPSTNDHYLRTSTLPEGSFVFSVPFFKGHQNPFQDFYFGSPQQQQQQQLNPVNDLEKTLVTASSAIFISSDQHSAMVGVVSLQMRLSKFNDLFLQALASQSDNCKGEGHSEVCNISCLDNEVLQCYLIDENGFIIASQSPGQDVGRFFGEVKNLQSIAEDLLYELDDKGFEKGVFKEYSMLDYQDICQIWKMVASGAHLSGFHILSKVFESLTWILEKLFVFLRQLPLVLWCLCLRIASGEDESQYPYFVLDELSFESNSTKYPDYFEFFDQTMIPFHLELLANNNSELLDSLMEDWRKMIFDKKSTKDIIDWFKEKYEQYKPQAIGLRPCTRKYHLFKAQFHVLPYHGVSESCLDSSLECRRLFSAAQVPQTNLILLAVDGSCDCDVITKVSIEPIEIADESCSGQSSLLFRKRPLDCFSDHEGEDSLKCKASNSTSSLLIHLIGLLLWRSMQRS